MRILNIMPLFKNLMLSVRSWRDFASCVKAYLSFPSSVVLRTYVDITRVVFDATFASPHVLASCCQNYCIHIMGDLRDDEEIKFVDEIVQVFGRHPDVHVRQLFPRLAGALAFANQSPENVDRVWEQVVKLATDPMVAVRASVLHHIGKFGQYYDWQGNMDKEREIDDLFVVMSRDTDPRVHALWEEKYTAFGVFLRKHMMPIESPRGLGKSSSAVLLKVRRVEKVVNGSSSASKAIKGSSGLLGHSLGMRRSNVARFTAKTSPMLLSGGEDPSKKKGLLQKKETSTPAFMTLPGMHVTFDLPVPS